MEIDNLFNLNECILCPRECRVDRTKSVGYCSTGNEIRIARAALHFMEEPCISGKNGSGTVFFSGCNLLCCYCQNYKISHENFGKVIDVKKLSQVFLQLQDKGANNINLVTATSYVPFVVQALDKVKNKLHIPVVYNCSGYDKVETIKRLNGYVDIYLADIKYFDDEFAIKYSNAPNYFNVASNAVKEMIRQTGNPDFEINSGDRIDNELLKRGVIIRHLVLPGGKNDSIKILQWLSKSIPSESYLISLMSQYTPYYNAKKFKEINRLVTSYEYNSVVNEAIKLGITNGYIQDKSSAKEEYTPDFNLEGC